VPPSGPRLTQPHAKIPRALAAVLIAVALFGLAWTLVVPPWQAPDENSHFAYTQSLAERFALPGDEKRPYGSTEQERADDASGSSRAAQRLGINPEWSTIAYDRWRRTQASYDRDNGGGPNPASQNPPTSYLYDAALYHVAAGGTVFDRLWVVRLGSLLCLLITTTAVWLLAGELFGCSRPLQLTASVVAGTFPMVTFIATSVSPDAMLYAEWSLALWLGTRILKRGLTARDALALSFVVGVSVTTKVTSFALVGGTLFVLAVGSWRLIRARAPGWWRPAATGVVAFAVPAGAWFVTAQIVARPAAPQLASSAPASEVNWREFVSYVWQFYLPKLPTQDELTVAPSGLYDIWIRQSWGAFGWLEVRFSEGTYEIFAALTALIAVGAILAIVKRCRRSDLQLLAFYGLVVVGLLAGLHWTEYNQLVQGNSFNQGRYLFPLIALFGVAVASTLALFRGAGRLVGAGLVVGAMAGFQLFSLAIVLARFYA
jgi:4-amino-4-deoxy-L-arabinose transferase-like glycosyltransferase